MVQISPSLLSADFSNLECEVKAIESAGADMLHLDIMDGHFVPNLTFGPCVVGAIRPHTTLFFDVHLMISDPLIYASAFKKAGADGLTLHIECLKDPHEALRQIKSLGMKAGFSVKPGTPVDVLFPFIKEMDMALVMTVEPGFGGQSFMPEQLNKIQALREKSKTLLIQADGGINEQTASEVIRAGGNVLVAGTAVFGATDYKTAMDKLRG